MTAYPRIVDVRTRASTRLQTFLNRPAFSEKAEQAAARALGAIRRQGDRAVAACARQFDGVALTPDRFRVDAVECRAAWSATDRDFRKALQDALRRIRAFARAGLRRDWQMSTPGGGRVGERFVPLDRVGIYVPGGQAPLVSTALMTVAPAQVAGVREIVACTPCDRDGKVHPYTLAALHAAGADEIYRIGGIQAIGLMAYGTRTTAKVQKIVGPGGAYVTAAKRQVYGHVALDLVAGPSEIAILADDSADPAQVAADLLSQLEHGTGWEKALLVTPSMPLARATARACREQAATLSRATTLRRALEGGALVAVVPSLEAGMALCNRFAPEHFELLVRRPKIWARRVTAAGAVFLGPWTPEAVGDFVAGPSHVLPTGGAAAMFSGLTADDFRRRSSLIEFTRRDLRQTLATIETFGRVENLDAHARSARIRFEPAATPPQTDRRRTNSVRRNKRIPPSDRSDNSATDPGGPRRRRKSP
jgi:histidinol dehydrogenase